MLNREELLNIEETALSFHSWTVEKRRFFHRIPETAWDELETTSHLAEELRQLGYRITEGPAAAAHRTGLIAELGCSAGPCAVLRFDIDALPVTETEDESHLPARLGFISRYPGAMHACGHDGHMAVGLACARIIAEHASCLKGTVRLIFQPAEEGCRGALEVVKEGWLQDADYFLAGHIVGRDYGQMDSGSCDCVCGVCGSLATTKINAFFTGHSCHGACPENGISAISALCSSVLTLNGIPRNSGGSTMVNIGRISGGEGRNIVAGEASMELEVRGETTELNQYMEDQAVRIISSSAELYGCSSRIETVGKAPSLVTSPDFHREILNVLGNLQSVKTSLRQERFKASEDAAWMMEEVKSHGGKAAFLLFPTDTTAPLHSSCYDFDESILSKAAAVFSCIVLNLLQN